MNNVLRKIKGIAVAAAASLVIAGGIYLTTDVDYTVFGPTAGLVAATMVGYAVKEGTPRLLDYLRGKGYEVKVDKPL